MAKEWTRKDDFAELLRAAACAVNNALCDGHRGGKPSAGSWRDETIDNQLKHIERHITAFQCGDQNEDHLAHIVCRAAIAMALRERSEESGTLTLPSPAKTAGEGQK